MTQGVFLGLLSGLLFLAAQSVFSSEGFAQRMWNDLQFKNSVQAAFSYKKRNYDYDGMCQDNVLPTYIRCVEHGDSFKLEMSRKGGGVYCADSTGFSGVQNESSNSPTCGQ